MTGRPCSDVDDFLQYVRMTREDFPQLERLPRFLIVRPCLLLLATPSVVHANVCMPFQGHSMGGAIAYLTARKSESAWTGVVFSGPGA